MSNTYEGWSNEETFMVASIIDNDQNYFKKVIREVTSILAARCDKVNDTVDPAKFVEDFLDGIVFSGFESRFKAQAKHNPERALMWTVTHEAMTVLRNRVNIQELAEHYTVKVIENLLEYTEIACGNASVLPENNYLIAQLMDKYMNLKDKTIIDLQVRNSDDNTVKDPLLDIVNSVDRTVSTHDPKSQSIDENDL